MSELPCTSCGRVILAATAKATGGLCRPCANAQERERLVSLATESSSEPADEVLDACRWHVERESHRYKQRALDHFRDRYQVLLAFLAANGLLSNPEKLLPVDNWLAFELRVRDLTPEGNELFRRCCDSWEPAFGQGHTQRHLVQWKRRLAEMRGFSSKPI